MPAQYAIRDPFRWLQAISRHAAVLSASTPFLLDLCVRVRRIDDDRRSALELAPLRALWIGGEPIPAARMHAFRQRFAPCGLAAEALPPATASPRRP